MTKFERDLMLAFGLNHTQARVAELLTKNPDSLAIAKLLNLQSTTVKGHISAIYRKVYGEPKREMTDLVKRLNEIRN